MRVMSFYLCPNERGSMLPGNFSQQSKTSMSYFERENMLRFSCARCVQFILFFTLVYCIFCLGVRRLTRVCQDKVSTNAD